MSLKKEELMQELSSRSIKYPENAARKKALKRTVRVPILIKNYHVHGFEVFNLSEQYKMTLVDPMYDIGGDTINLFNELPEHLNKNDRQLLLATTGLYKQHNMDKRKMLLYVTVNCMLKLLKS